MSRTLADKMINITLVGEREYFYVKPRAACKISLRLTPSNTIYPTILANRFPNGTDWIVAMNFSHSVLNTVTLMILLVKTIFCIYAIVCATDHVKVWLALDGVQLVLVKSQSIVVNKKLSLSTNGVTHTCLMISCYQG